MSASAPSSTGAIRGSGSGTGNNNGGGRVPPGAGSVNLLNVYLGDRVNDPVNAQMVRHSTVPAALAASGGTQGQQQQPQPQQPQNQQPQNQNPQQNQQQQQQPTPPQADLWAIGSQFDKQN